MGVNDTQVVDINDRNYWSLSQLSTAFGPARETISKRLKQANIMAVKKRSGFDVFHIGEAARAILAGEMPSFEKVEDPDALPPKERLDYYRGENEKRKFLTESGHLADVADVAAEMAGIVKICIRTLDTLPDMLEMKCGLSAEGVQVVELECDHAREDLAKQLVE